MSTSFSTRTPTDPAIAQRDTALLPSSQQQTQLSNSTSNSGSSLNASPRMRAPASQPSAYLNSSVPTDTRTVKYEIHNPKEAIKSEWCSTMIHMSNQLNEMQSLLLDIRKLLCELQVLLGGPSQTSVNDVIQNLDNTFQSKAVFDSGLTKLDHAFKKLKIDTTETRDGVKPSDVDGVLAKLTARTNIFRGYLIGSTPPAVGPMTSLPAGTNNGAYVCTPSASSSTSNTAQNSTDKSSNLTIDSTQISTGESRSGKRKKSPRSTRATLHLNTSFQIIHKNENKTIKNESIITIKKLNLLQKMVNSEKLEKNDICDLRSLFKDYLDVNTLPNNKNVAITNFINYENPSAKDIKFVQEISKEIISYLENYLSDLDDEIIV